MIELLFELDFDGIYSDWIKTCDDEFDMLGIIGFEVQRYSKPDELPKVRHFSVLVTCDNKRVLSRDLIRFGKVL